METFRKQPFTTDGVYVLNRGAQRLGISGFYCMPAISVVPVKPGIRCTPWALSKTFQLACPIHR